MAQTFDGWMPTPRLRFVDRWDGEGLATIVRDDRTTVKQAIGTKKRILQQWWVKESVPPYERVGEWRDVPIEVE